MDSSSVIQTIQENSVIAIVRGIPLETIARTAEALYAGGIRAIEVTCNTEGYLQCIRELSESWGDKMVVGAGTVLHSAAVQLVLDAGAQFVLAPDLNPEVVSAVHERGKLMIPGVMTATEMLQARRLGVELLKLFPAGALGANYLKEIRGPLNDLPMIPVGGINQSNIAEFARAGAFAVGVGSELVDKAAVAAGNVEALTERAQKLIAAFQAGRQQ
ncbi:bifunctional 4-hydroxy-2-oxoglutarate aldolase/2-dehydro-3-deoxy-phosphogluconate aldolase [Paenibacillus turpanensis]|uniref:bifunctional 4-hydroxy-2-oxoglutarate aldolase/2-dehydro-3-deoxy-phosphogluconate aldolase n=1 Tax=Paenibacillus turpanensis TaxID=2689078 RepID=UPI00140755A1|nr:bifunctional 4-hydroxy-2-oxoglutarate aldolase/2-dehydro-3-deoxy-phosphogluconate aldolase [Paenibacillus turpanensis]